MKTAESSKKYETKQIIGIKLNNSSCVGGIPSAYIDETVDEINSPLPVMFNLSLSQENVPESWWAGNVIPLLGKL